MKLLPARNLHLRGLPCSVYRCAGGIGSKFLFDAFKQIVEEEGALRLFAGGRTECIPQSATADDQGRIVRSPNAYCPRGTCDRKILTTAICSGLHECSVNCIHPAQRCVFTS